MLVRVYGKDMIYKQCIGNERGVVSQWDNNLAIRAKHGNHLGRRLQNMSTSEYEVL